MLHWGYLADDQEIDLIRICQERNIGLICMKGMAGGRSVSKCLTGRPPAISGPKQGQYLLYLLNLGQYFPDAVIDDQICLGISGSGGTIN